MIYTFSNIIQQSAKRFPQHDAFRCGKEAITYADLHQKTNQLAHFLVNAGVQKGDRVGVYLNRCLDTAIAIYGIMKAGAVYVPIDTTAPHHRSLFLIKDCDIEYLVSNKTQRRKLQAIANEKSGLKGIIGVQQDWAIPTISWTNIFEESTASLSLRILEQDPAYIIYTSGSTGIPKGIMHSHYSGLSYARLTADLYELNEHDRIGNHAPLHFDISTLGFFTAPLVGATTIIVPEAYTRLPASLATLMEKEKITVWYSVPLALIQILQQDLIASKDFSALKWILYGGEPFPLKYLQQLMDELPQVTFSNVYGPAEVNQCTYYNFKKIAPTETSVPLGQAWNATEVLIVDDQDTIITDDSVGELLVRSATRMMGYWKQADLTERSYYRRSLVTGVEQIFYRTGDLVKRRVDGQLMFLGRKDRQIKIRGYRVELDEVEAKLLKHKEVREAVTFSLIAGEQKSIEAAVILHPHGTIDSKNLLVYLNQQLPSYAVPNRIHILEDLPRTSTGKISRQALKQQFSHYERSLDIPV